MAHDNTNRWTLNKNERKQQETHADYTGKINIGGQEYWLNGWIKEGPNGKFISGTIKPKEPVSTGRHSFQPGGKVKREDPISTGRFNDDMQDDIPF